MATIRFEAVFSHFPSGPLVCALLVASGLVWTVMFFGPLAHLSRLAGGESPFDIRPMGYSYEEAYAFLRAIGERGRRYYANRELLLDMFYPPLYAISRGLALWWLMMPGRLRDAPVPLSWRYALIAVPTITASLDVVENDCIARNVADMARSVPRPGTCLELGYSHEDERRGADGIIDGHACDIVVGAAELNGSSA
jgi:hypothetical protein